MLPNAERSRGGPATLDLGKNAIPAPAAVMGYLLFLGTSPRFGMKFVVFPLSL